jgi:hypothetical protein
MADNVLRRKSDQDRKTVQIRLRVTEEEKAKLLQAAKRSGAMLSSWLRTLGIDHAEGGCVVECVALKDRYSETAQGTHGRRKRALGGSNRKGKKS